MAKWGHSTGRVKRPITFPRDAEIKSNASVLDYKKFDDADEKKLVPNHGCDDLTYFRLCDTQIHFDHDPSGGLKVVRTGWSVVKNGAGARLVKEDAVTIHLNQKCEVEEFDIPGVLTSSNPVIRVPQVVTVTADDCSSVNRKNDGADYGFAKKIAKKYGAVKEAFDRKNFEIHDPKVDALLNSPEFALTLANCSSNGAYREMIGRGKAGSTGTPGGPKGERDIPKPEKKNDGAR